MEHQERMRPTNSEGSEVALSRFWVLGCIGEACVRTVKSMDMKRMVLGEGTGDCEECWKRVIVRLDEVFSPENEKVEDQTELLRISRG